MKIHDGRPGVSGQGSRILIELIDACAARVKIAVAVGVQHIIAVSRGDIDPGLARWRPADRRRDFDEAVWRLSSNVQDIRCVRYEFACQASHWPGVSRSGQG